MLNQCNAHQINATIQLLKTFFLCSRNTGMGSSSDDTIFHFVLKQNRENKTSSRKYYEKRKQKQMIRTFPTISVFNNKLIKYPITIYWVHLPITIQPALFNSLMPNEGFPRVETCDVAMVQHFHWRFLFHIHHSSQKCHSFEPRNDAKQHRQSVKWRSLVSAITNHRYKIQSWEIEENIYQMKTNCFHRNHLDIQAKDHSVLQFSQETL